MRGASERLSPGRAQRTSALSRARGSARKRAMPESGEVTRDYEARQRELEALHGELSERDGRLSTLRGLAFLATLGVALYGLFRPSSPLWMGVGVLALGFLVLVVLHAIT